MSKVFIGVGHGGNDPGAVANDLKEADMNLVMALAMKAELERHGVNVGISRIKDENDDLNEEIQEANAFQPDLAIDVHDNSGGGDGFEALTQTNKFAETSVAIAKAIEKEVIAIGQNSRGLKTRLNSSGTDYFGFLRLVKCPAIIVEGCFLDSTDRFIADVEAEQKAFGVAYAKGILSFLGIPYIQLNELLSALTELKSLGIINDLDYWNQHSKDIPYFDKLIVAVAEYISNKNEYTAETAIESLVQKGIINSPDYWLKNYSKVDYFDRLLINIAGAL